MMAFLACRRDLSSRAVAEAAWGSGDAHVPSIATRQSRPQAVGARGAPHLPFGIASKPSPSVPWARGLLSASWEWGPPDLPACGLWCGSVSGPSPANIEDLHEGPSLVRQATQDLLEGGLTRLAREGRRDQVKGHLARFLSRKP